MFPDRIARLLSWVIDRDYGIFWPWWVRRHPSRFSREAPSKRLYLGEDRVLCFLHSSWSVVCYSNDLGCRIEQRFGGYISTAYMDRGLGYVMQQAERARTWRIRRQQMEAKGYDYNPDAYPGSETFRRRQ